MTFKRTGYVFFGTRYGFSDSRRVEAPATSRHTSHSLRLLPSGPDRVHELLLREDQGLHRFFILALITKECVDYQASLLLMQAEILTDFAILL